MSRPTLTHLQDDRLRLRPLEEADLPLTLAWRNRDDIRCCFVHSDVITPEQHQAWFESYSGRDDDLVFVIEACGRQFRPVGQIALYHIDREAGTAEFGRLMIGDPAAREQGLAQAATRLLLEAAFAQLSLREVRLVVFAHNEPAVATYERLGFQRHARHGDLLFMTLTRGFRTKGLLTSRAPDVNV
jgi:RimJ/RimL family protein N-acetyltransferase